MVSNGNQRRFWTAAVQRTFLFAAAVGVAAVLSSCNSATVNAVAPADVDPLDKIRSLDIMPKQADGVGLGHTDVGQRGRATVYEGTEITDVADARIRPVPASGGGYDLNFENTPVATVAKVVIGDILGTGYTIDPR